MSRRLGRELPGWLRRRRGSLGIAVVAAAVLVAAEAWARVGGGQSFGGGHSSGGGGGGGVFGVFDMIIDIISLLFFLIELCVDHPVVGFSILGLLAVGVIYFAVAQRSSPAFAKALRTDEAHRFLRVARARRVNLDDLRADDPNFSEILFLDFVQMIYARYQEARGAAGDVQSLTPFLAPNLLEALQADHQTDRRVEGVIIGESHVAAVDRRDNLWIINVELETNYLEKPATGGGENAWYTKTTLAFGRKPGVKSKGPEFTRSLNCPSCGSPVKIDASGACAYCGKVCKPGEFAWQLASLLETQKTPRVEQPLDLGGAELGVDLPTTFDPNLDLERKTFGLMYPDFRFDEFQNRARDAFLTLQKAWSDRSWETARPLETDRLFQTHLFWIQRYLDRGLTNRLDEVAVEKMVVARVARDPYFDTITVRIFASMIDCTVDAQGKVVAGDAKTPRRFSEYWTFIRRAGFKKKAGAATGEDAMRQCPSCGAPLKISMAGVCEFCGSHVTGGDFDWTLAKIEQDEAYIGA